MRSTLSFFFLTLTLTAACGDDTGGTGGATSSAGSGGAATTTSTGAQGSTTGTGSSATSSSGGTGGETSSSTSGGGGETSSAGGSGGGATLDCDDDAAVCAGLNAVSEECGRPGIPEGDCAAVIGCQRAILRDDAECPIFTCQVGLACDESCADTIAAIEPTATGASFLSSCEDEVVACDPDEGPGLCEFYGRVGDDALLESLSACFGAPCDELRDCFDVAFEAIPECPDA